MNTSTPINPTYIDYAILGLVNQKPLSGYGIQQIFKTTALGNYSSSPGTIYPALKRLQKFGLVESRQKENSSRKFFHLTSRGKVFLVAWLLNPISIDDIKKRMNELLLRFAFMDDLIGRTEKLSFLKSFHDQTKEYIGQLEAFHANKSADMPLHGSLAFEHRIDSYKMSLKWSKKALSQIENI